MKNHLYLLFIAFFGLFFHSCQTSNPQSTEIKEEPKTLEATLIQKKEPKIYTPYSELENEYSNFDSPKAINEAARIENEYFQNYEEGFSPYYGTIWEGMARTDTSGFKGETTFATYKQAYEAEHDSLRGGMHCTIYAVEVLQAGLGSDFEKLEKSHKRIWKEREHAGWSIGHLLVKEWNWKAYLFLDRDSKEFDQCIKAYKNTKTYPVWRQPAIPLEALYIRGEEDSLIQQVLLENEYGWGFSEQGWHTWFTRFDKVKECNWAGAPGKQFELSAKPLFITTSFLNYYDYDSHIVVFPPKKN